MRFITLSLVATLTLVACATMTKWSDKDHEARVQHMKTVVMPAAHKIFHEYDSTTYEENDCTLCHGQRAKNGIFEMPNPNLPKFSQSMFTEYPEMSEFMKNHVVPMMAAALGVKPYDPVTQQGLGCNACHPM